jgi:hypothetical protein
MSNNDSPKFGALFSPHHICRPNARADLPLANWLCVFVTDTDVPL